MSRLAGLIFCLFFPAFVYGDGGTLQFRRQAGPLTMTLFSAPAPLRVGVADLSVIVQGREDRLMISDARVEFELAGRRISATHEQAANRLFYAAPVSFAEAGATPVKIRVSWRDVQETVTGLLRVEPKIAAWAAYWPYLALAPGGILLFALHQTLKTRRTRRTYTAK